MVGLYRFIMILHSYQNFLAQILSEIEKRGIDISKYELDHIGYQASSNEDYDTLLPEFKKLGQMLSENSVGGRRVAVFELTEPLSYKNYSIPAIELIAPKEGQNPPSDLEHIEFVIDEKFDDFVKRYPDLPWDMTKVDQPTFPMVTLKLGDTIQVKFHYTPVLEIVKH